ncbi:MAG: type II toxin-antitoxin system HipA family toxin [Gemmatimonadetes bacterium]|nr:type II toxin-antitoxin system HipA family toxin [Gemmatimonadota bacterium]MYJ39041.1 type II toxin-antitoxin system HipA family toxin [Gemmatimonadota bacterium]
MTLTLNVWYDGDLIGFLRYDRHSRLLFSYDRGRRTDPPPRPISHSFPAGHRHSPTDLCLPYFEGLLPDGARRSRAAAALGTTWDDTLRLLAGLGAEVAGALTLLPAREDPVSGSGRAVRPLSKDELIRILEVGEDRLRLSLAGTRSKLPVVLVDGRPALPAEGQVTTHVLKPAIPDMEWTTENEAYSMRLAARVGLEVAPIRIGVVDGRKYLIIKRYDREEVRGGSVRRLHQEDFCQALGVLPEVKYASDGGPGFARCFSLIRETCTFPAIGVLKLLDAAIFQVIIGNADAHAGSYSLLWRQSGEVALAPLRDLMSTVSYPELRGRFAMEIAGRGTLEEMRAGDWGRFAKRCGLGAPFVRRRVGELCKWAIWVSDSVAAELASPGLSEEALMRLAGLVKGRAQRLRRGVPK